MPAKKRSDAVEQPDPIKNPEKSKRSEIVKQEETLKQPESIQTPEEIREYESVRNEMLAIQSKRTASVKLEGRSPPSDPRLKRIKSNQSVPDVNNGKTNHDDKSRIDIGFVYLHADHNNLRAVIDLVSHRDFKGTIKMKTSDLQSVVTKLKETSVVAFQTEIIKMPYGTGIVQNAKDTIDAAKREANP